MKKHISVEKLLRMLIFNQDISIQKMQPPEGETAGDWTDNCWQYVIMKGNDAKGFKEIGEIYLHKDNYDELNKQLRQQ